MTIPVLQDTSDRLLKNKGFQIGNTELESGDAIRKFTIIMLTAVVRIMQMRLAYDDEREALPIEEVFTQGEINCLKQINYKLQGKKEKLQNHCNPERTKWATWIIGRLGGWSGYQSQGPPALLTLKTRLERFTYMLKGFLLAKDMGTR